MSFGVRNSLAWRVFTIAIGIVPATVFMIFAFFRWSRPSDVLQPSERRRLVLITILGAAALNVIGYGALWLAAARSVLTAKIAWCLVVGLTGAGSAAALLLAAPDNLSSAVYWLFGPVVVAVAQLLRFVTRA